jgi:peptidoglycan/LPS O-acetylase OafA/YrhL
MAEINGRNFYVDALRTVAISLVILLHAPLYLAVPAVVPNSGYYGVSMFFVISGFLITSGAMHRYASLEAISFRSFYLFRASRIGPGLCLLVLLNVGALYAGGEGFGLVKQEPNALPELLFYVFTFQANHYVSYLPNEWGILWSLSIEEIFYLFFPIVCFLIRPKSALVVFLLALFVIGLMVRFWYGTPAIYFCFGCFDQLALGCLTAMAVGRLPVNFRSILLLCAGLAICVATYWLIDPISTFGPSAMAVGSALFIAGSVGLSAPASHIIRSLTLPGQWSYELYLFHFFILKVLSASGILLVFRGLVGSRATTPIALAIMLIICGSIFYFLLSPASQLIRLKFQPLTIRRHRETLGPPL